MFKLEKIFYFFVKLMRFEIPIYRLDSTYLTYDVKLIYTFS